MYIPSPQTTTGAGVGTEVGSGVGVGVGVGVGTVVGTEVGTGVGSGVGAGVVLLVVVVVEAVMVVIVVVVVVVEAVLAVVVVIVVAVQLLVLVVDVVVVVVGVELEDEVDVLPLVDGERVPSIQLLQRFGHFSCITWPTIFELHSCESEQNAASRLPLQRGATSVVTNGTGVDVVVVVVVVVVVHAKYTVQGIHVRHDSPDVVVPSGSAMQGGHSVAHTWASSP